MMSNQKQVRVQINCQKGVTVEMAVPLNAGSYEKDTVCAEVSETVIDGCRLGRLCLRLEGGVLDGQYRLAQEAPVRVFLPVSERPERITAMYLFNPWWTRPAFIERLEEIPPRTQTAFFRYKNRFACFVPMVGRQYKTSLAGGTETELCLEMTACCGGQSRLEEPLYLYAEGDTLAEAVHTAFAYLAKQNGIRLREQRRVPEMFRYLGWCSWDAFRTEVSEDGLRQKAAELAEKQVPVRWMLIDDGWFTARDKRLYDFAPDPVKFPNGFQQMIADIRKAGGIRWFGVWHTLGGYWGGVVPDSPLAAREADCLYQCANGTLVPSPRTGAGFYDDWYRMLSADGIDFVKVDAQSAVPFYFADSLPLGEAARGMNEALESGAYRMDGAVINCMGMAMENLLARPASAVSRNSDDFVPDRKNGFAEHLLQNAYNAIYHNEIYCCDWDMFWTKHEDAVKHSLLRAVSGGPVYFSDRVGDTRPDILKPLAYKDGRLLLMERSARPTEDCVFSDPLAGGVLKLHNIASWAGRKGGGIAAYNLTGDIQTVTFTPADIPDLTASERYWVFDYFRRTVRSLGYNEIFEDTLTGEEAAWYVLLPDEGRGTCLGLTDKYVGFSAVESIRWEDNTEVTILRASGQIGWAAHKPPQKVLADGRDVTDRLESRGDLHILSLPETAEKTVFMITW